LDAVYFASSRQSKIAQGALAHPRTERGHDLMNQQKMMGFQTPDDQRVSIVVRDWNAMKLALWRSRTAWEIVGREAATILGRCDHVADCEGKDNEKSPCLPGCIDRELRMSALVILNAARMFAPIAHRPANAPYIAPSREYFSEVVAELAATQLENEKLREALQGTGTPLQLEETS
jgi:hypothetical protein